MNTDYDAEIEAMKVISDAFVQLDAGAQERVLAWIANRFGIRLMADTRRVHSTVGANESPLLESRGRLAQTELALFAHPAELFEAARPKTDAEKSLVIGYWFQVCQGNTTFISRQVNDELKRIGYGVGNITRALDALTDGRPAFAMQLEKSGKTQQAQKKFKLTHEGIKRVQHLLAGVGDES